MSEVRRVSRWFVVCLGAVVLGSCAAPARDPNPGPGGGTGTTLANPCAKGVPQENKQAPIVCIDDTNRILVAKPDRIRVHDAKADDRATPVGIEWYTKSGTGDVRVRLDPSCRAVKIEHCNGNGKCEAETVPGTRSECKYDVWITGGKHELLDPTVIVDACCS